MKHWVAGLLLAASSGALAGAARAQDTRGPSRYGTAGSVEEDADLDGRVTWPEARTAALALFEHLDRDEDGLVTQAEATDGASRWRAQRLETRFASLDRDRDGGLSEREINRSARAFARADRDGDRRLTRMELFVRYQQAADGAADTTALRSAFWRRDANHDGRVTRAEVLAAADRRFVRRDRDRNGVLTQGEQRCPPGRSAAARR